MSLPTLSLRTTAVSGTYPFTTGVALKKGEASAIACDLSQYQVQVKRRWNDNSIKHAVISGRAALTHNVPRTVTVTAGTPPSGTALTAADIAAAAPTASVQCGAFGTVTLTPLLEGAPVRTWHQGHEMVECHYRAAIGGGTLLDVQFHVRLYADGRTRVRIFVTNGTLGGANADRSYVPSVIIGGVTVFNNGGVTLVHRALGEWMAEGWIGGDPQVVALHDVANLRASKLASNYSHTSPSSGALNALDQTYTPMDRAGHVQNMGATGFADAIGLLPKWDAIYCTSGDARALKACEVGSWSLRSYPIGYRNPTTKLPIKPSDFPTFTPFGAFGGGTDSLGNADLTWEYNHAPSAGYLAYLLTGDYDHYETMLLQASVHYLCVDTANGQGVNRVLRRQVRGTAWALRTIGQLCAIAPDSEIQAGQIVADYRTLLANQYVAHKAVIDANGTQAWSGSIYQYSYGQWGGTGSVSTWMTDFWVAVNGYLSDLEPLADTTNLIAVRNWMYRWVVGRLGRSGVSSEHDFTRAGAYGHVFATDDTGATWHQTWGAVHTATYGLANTVEGNALQGGSGSNPVNAATGYWGNLLPAIAYAVEHGATGAAAAYARLTGASNWSVVQASGFDDIPIWGIAPRAAEVSIRQIIASYWSAVGSKIYGGINAPVAPPPSSGLPAWVTAVGLHEVGEIPNTKLTDMAYAASSVGSGGKAARVYAWCGAALKRQGSVYMIGAAGGHADYGGNEATAIALNTANPAWTLLRGPSDASVITDGAGAYNDRRRSATHTYYGKFFDNAHNRLMITPAPGMGIGGRPPQPENWPYQEKTLMGFSLGTNDWLDPDTFPEWPGSGDFTACLVVPNPLTGDFVYARNNDTNGRAWKFTASSGTWTQTANSVWGQNYAGAALDTLRMRFLSVGSFTAGVVGPRVFNFSDTSFVGANFTGLGASALHLNGYPGLVYDEKNDKYLVFSNGASNIQVLSVDAATWNVSALALTGSIPNRQNGIHTAAQYVPELGIVVICYAANQNLRFFRTTLNP